MLNKPVSIILLVILILGIAVVSSVDYKGSLAALAAGSPQPIVYLPINITNTQSIATPSPFQVMINVNSSEYAAYEAADLSNIAFTYPNGTVIPSWLESGNSNSSTDTVYWIKVGSIPATSTVIISMNFYNVTDTMLNNVTTGEAPDLSPTRGQYDNGASVFVVYGDFVNSMDGWLSYQNTGNFVPTPSSGGIEMLDGNSWEETYLVSPVALPQIPVEVEEGWTYNGNTAANGISMFGSSPFGTSKALIVQGVWAPVLTNSVSTTFDPWTAVTVLEESVTKSTANNQVSSASFTSGGRFSIVSFLAANATWASSGYAVQDVSLGNFGSTLIPTVVSGNIPNPFSQAALIISAGDGGQGPFQYVQWVVVRALPPNSVAPSVTVDNVVVVPEFPSIAVLPLFMVATLLAVVAYRRKHILR